MRRNPRSGPGNDEEEGLTGDMDTGEFLGMSLADYLKDGILFSCSASVVEGVRSVWKTLNRVKPVG